MKLEFKNSKGVRRLIGSPSNVKEAFDIIKKFLDEHNYKSYYTRINFLEDEWELDVGSWSEFFYLSELTDDALKQLQEAQADE